MEEREKDVAPDPQRFSTNKRVRPLGENIFGTEVRKASGAKTVRPGDAEATSAKVVPKGETANQRNARREQEARQANDNLLIERESFLTEARKKIFSRGWLTNEEKEGMILYARKSRETRA